LNAKLIGGAAHVACGIETDSGGKGVKID